MLRLYNKKMRFDSLQFILFFIVITLAYYSLRRGRWLLLLLASCYFYMAFKPVYILILFLTIVIDYFAGIWVEQAQGSKRKWLLVLSIITNVGILAFFKYFDFFSVNANGLFYKLGTDLQLPILKQLYPDLILPIGLSFHTFQAMSYTIEVYRGNQKSERHFGIYALYVMFYPQLVAGPIERPQNVLWQFHKYFDYDFENIKAGLMQMAFGFFKKVVIADRLAMMQGPAYLDPQHHNGLTLLVATFFYTFRIYCDFSGYSDIALGAARVMGFKLMDNFNTPYSSSSIAEFWGRWHISLSTWFRDYLYIPLGGNRVGEGRAYFNRMFVFLVSGLWHGASWNFVIWGGLHGFYLLMASVRDKYFKINTPKNALYASLQVAFTFCLVMLTWVFFAVGNGSVRNSFLILKKIALLSFTDQIQSKLNTVEMWFSLALILFLVLKEKYLLQIPTKNTAWFFVVFLVLMLANYFFGVFNANQFIYFQF
jgi:alginate O-acetyltransferase complex protein AlgI